MERINVEITIEEKELVVQILEESDTGWQSLISKSSIPLAVLWKAALNAALEEDQEAIKLLFSSMKSGGGV